MALLFHACYPLSATRLLSQKLLTGWLVVPSENHSEPPLARRAKHQQMFAAPLPFQGCCLPGIRFSWCLFWLLATNCSCAWTRARLVCGAWSRMWLVPRPYALRRSVLWTPRPKVMIRKLSHPASYAWSGATVRLAVYRHPEALAGLVPVVHSENLLINTL